MPTTGTPTRSTLEDLERTADRLFDDSHLPAETIEIRDRARDFATSVLLPRAAELNSAEESVEAFPRDLVTAIADADLYRVLFPADVGGLGLEFPTLAAAVVLEELGYYSPGVASALYDGQALLVGRTLDNAPPALRAEGRRDSRLVRHQ